MSTKDGGPAFPVAYWDGDKMRYVDSGMSMRDYFAAQCISGYCPGSAVPEDHIKDLASWAYRLADAMITERAK